MTQPPVTVEALAERVKEALESGDRAFIEQLLTPDVRWGAPDDPTPSCQNRGQVLAWYQRGAAGARVSVFETTARGNKILVGSKMVGGPDTKPDQTRDRWQLLTVDNGQVTDIRGFDHRDEAFRRLDL